jgi:hypothetical protein
VKVRDDQTYIKRSTVVQWVVKKAPSGVHQRPVGVQMYSCTAVWGSTDRCCYRGWWQLIFSKKGPRHVQLRIVRKTIGQMREGDGEESRSPKPPTLGNGYKARVV